MEGNRKGWNATENVQQIWLEPAVQEPDDDDDSEITINDVKNCRAVVYRQRRKKYGPLPKRRQQTIDLLRHTTAERSPHFCDACTLTTVRDICLENSTCSAYLTDSVLLECSTAPVMT